MGIVPVKVLPKILNVVMLANCPRSTGIGPVSWFWNKSNSVILVSRPSSIGSDPLMAFDAKAIDSLS